VAEVVDLYISPDKGKVMQQKKSVTAIAGVGLEGDRYSTGDGAYSHSKLVTIRHASLIGLEAIIAANQRLDQPFAPAETRRNIVTTGTDLNELVGEFFSIGAVAMVGIELCKPCERPSTLVDKAQFGTAFENLGGLRVGLLNSGIIELGDQITV
jgi:MOSC domain-containing protein YiiM